MNNNCIAEYFLKDEASFDELEILVQEMEPVNSFESRVSELLERTTRTLIDYGNVLKKMNELMPLDCEAYIKELQLFVKGEIAFESLKNFDNECRLLKVQEEFLPVIHGIRGAFYTHLIISMFLNVPRPQVHPLSEVKPSLFRPDRVVSRMVHGKTTITDPPAHRSLAEYVIDQVSSFCSEIDRNEVANSFWDVMDVLSLLRKELLSNALRLHGTGSFAKTVERYVSSDDARRVGIPLVSCYGKYLTTQLLNAPQKVFSKKLVQLNDDFRKYIELAKLENKVADHYGLPRAWRVSTTLFDIENFKKLLDITHDPCGQFLIANYYSSISFDRTLSAAWAEIGSLNHNKDALLLFSRLNWNQGKCDLAIECLRSALAQGEDSDIEYALACIVFGKTMHRQYDFELATDLLCRATRKQHSGATCLSAFFHKIRWKRSGAESDLQESLDLYTKSAEMGFGRAKVELELFVLNKWNENTSSKDNVEELCRQAMTGDQVAAYLFFLSKPFAEVVRKSGLYF